MGKIQVLCLLCFALLGAVAGAGWGDEKLINVSQLEMFVDELPRMPTLLGFKVSNGVPVNTSLNIGMFLKKWKFHRDLPRSRVFAYGTNWKTATVPGPTIEALYGVDTYVKWRNKLPSKHILPWDPTIPTAIPATKRGIPTVVHLHGGIQEPQSDGHAGAWFTRHFRERGSTWTQKRYHYRNFQQPGNLWYHDHATGLTRVNLLAGLIGAYIIRDPAIESPLRLPEGDEFDRPLIVFDRSFRVDGSIYMNKTGNNPSIHPQWRPEYFGDAIIVNGKAWPRLDVRRRRYRFRIINASNARFFNFFFSNGLRFIHIGSDSSYNRHPVIIKKLLLAPSEIADVVVDFSESESDSAILENAAAYPYPGGDPVDEFNGKVMKFIIKQDREVETSRVPKRLIDYPWPNISRIAATRYITMYEYTSTTGQPTHMYINGISFEKRATETPKAGTSEIWNVINLTGDNHPLHIHLGLLVALEQRELVDVEQFKECMSKFKDAVKCEIRKYARGNRTEIPAQEQGWKNVFKMMPGYVTQILVRFAYIHTDEPYRFDASAEPGYVYHCHILDHEDNEMMRPLKLVK